MRLQLREHEQGLRVPLDVEVPDLPANAPPLVAKLYEELKKRWGLRAAVGDDRPLPLSCSEVKAALRIDRTPTEVTRLFNWMMNRGIIHLACVLPGTKTKCWSPGPGAKVGGAVPHSASRVEVVERVGGELVGAHPVPELGHEPLVSDAEQAAPAGDLDRLHAATNGTLDEVFT